MRSAVTLTTIILVMCLITIQKVYRVELPHVPNPPKITPTGIIKPSPLLTELTLLQRLRTAASYETKEFALLNSALNIGGFEYITFIVIDAKKYTNSEHQDDFLYCIVLSDKAPETRKEKDGSINYEFSEFRLYFIFSDNFTRTSIPKHYTTRKRDNLQIPKKSLIYSSTARTSDIALIQNYSLY